CSGRCSGGAHSDAPSAPSARLREHAGRRARGREEAAAAQRGPCAATAGRGDQPHPSTGRGAVHAGPGPRDPQG
ncbi:unnamed protein product, partial [Effrenium voratum]